MYRILLGLILYSMINFLTCEERRSFIITPNAPSPLGAYSQGVLAGKTLYLSAQRGFDIKLNKTVPGGAEAETIQALKNLEAIIEAAGGKLGHIVKLTNYVKDINDLKEVNEGYRKVFVDNFPARASFQVAALPVSGRIEIDGIAVLD